jgi:hypothetical protein
LRLAGFAQTREPPKPLTNDDVLEMSRAGVPESTILLAIQKTPVKFATGATPWALYEFELPVGKTASNINFGVLLSGTGTARVDAMKIELGGEPYSNGQIDFDFESPTAKGFYTGGGGTGSALYKVGIDDTVSYSGHQSLTMQYVGDVAAQK